MIFNLAELNWLAIGAAALASFLIGGVWYGAVFSAAWARLYGYDDARLQSMASTQAMAFGLFFVADLLAAFVFAILFMNLAGEQTLTNAFALAGLLWVGVGAANALQQKAAHRLSPATFAMDAGHHLLSLLAIAAVIGAWR
ncbi:MAG: DUF1761 domain-containing protein [Phycisphaerales bacterium]